MRWSDRVAAGGGRMGCRLEPWK